MSEEMKIASSQGWPNGYHMACIMLVRCMARAERWADIAEAAEALREVHRRAEGMRREVLAERSARNEASSTCAPQPANRQ